MARIRPKHNSAWLGEFAILGWQGERSILLVGTLAVLLHGRIGVVGNNMTLKITLSPEMEAKIRAIASTAGQDVETFVLNALDEKLAAQEMVESTKSGEDFEAWLRRWIALHPQGTHFVDDSRESIYEGRGE